MVIKSGSYGYMYYQDGSPILTDDGRMVPVNCPNIVEGRPCRATMRVGHEGCVICDSGHLFGPFTGIKNSQEDIQKNDCKRILRPLCFSFIGRQRK